MKNLRTYGAAPFSLVVIHGGPGGTGEVAPVAEELSTTHGVLEPLQTKLTIEGQLQELKDVVQKFGTPPLTLIGYSWGAWLSFIFAAQNPELVKKLILVSSGPFEAPYATQIMPTRLARLPAEEQSKLTELLNTLNTAAHQKKDKLFAQLGTYISKADAYDILPAPKHEPTTPHYNIYESIWPEAAELRSSGKLLAYGKQIQCPVVAIHGDYDPHPYHGVKDPLSTVLKDFQFILLEKCGHKPWIERWAQKKFYKILNLELN